jgi:HSP20 family protein
MFGVTTKTPRDPMFDLLYRLERRMGRFFNEPFGFIDWTAPESATAGWMPLVDIFEEPDFIRLVAEVPGVKPENVQIAVEGNVLTIKGNKEQVAEEKYEKVHRYERTYGTFERTFTLPATVAPDKIKATYEHGLLTIVLPKVEAAKPHLIKVEVATPQKALK